MASQRSGPLQADKFVVLLEVDGQWRRLINVRFERVSGQLGFQVDLPHYAHSLGVLSSVSSDVPPGGTTTIDLEPRGTTTTQFLKYSHHPDGRAHFSQDGRAITKVITRTPPLRDMRGHLFTVHYWGADPLALAKERDRRPRDAERTQPLFIDAVGESQPPRDLGGRIIGLAYAVRSISIRSGMPPNGDWSRAIAFRRGDGSVGQGIVAMPRDPRPGDLALIISHVPSDRSGSPSKDSLVFSTALYAPEGAIGPLTGMMLVYQDRDTEDWRQTVARLGSSDLYPDESQSTSLTIIEPT